MILYDFMISKRWKSMLWPFQMMLGVNWNGTTEMGKISSDSMVCWHWMQTEKCVLINCFWLVVSNMAFIFHFIYGIISFPLTNSYFSRLLKLKTITKFEFSPIICTRNPVLSNWSQFVGWYHLKTHFLRSCRPPLAEWLYNPTIYLLNKKLFLWAKYTKLPILVILMRPY